jgi:UDP-glucose 4-epimerase
MFETLCSKEEISKSENMEKYYRVPADMRDLNYTKYVQSDGTKLQGDEYNSDNTKQLNVKELKELLLTIDYVKRELEEYEA